MSKKYKIQRTWPEAVFSGSLIQQNHGESLDHGYYEWDLTGDRPECEFEILNNEYGFYTLHINDGVIPIRENVPEKPRLRLKVKNTNPAELKRVKTDLKRVYDVQEITVNRLASSTKDSGDRNFELGDVTSTNYQTDLIADYVKRNFAVDDRLLSKIQTINQKLNQELDEKDLAKSLRWEPLEFRFSNMFSYGEDNVIDFSKMGGIMGIFAENATGKSSLFGALCYCLYAKSPRTYKSQNVLNTSKESFRCALKFKVGDQKYIIDRSAEKKTAGRVAESVDFYEIQDNGEKKSLNAKSKRKTDQKIRRYVGEYDEFILTTLSVQDNNTVFIDKSQSERKDVLAQFIGIDVFDELYKLAKDKSRDLKGIIKEFENEDLSSKAAKAERSYKEYKARYQELKEEKKTLSEEKSEKMDEILQLNKKLKDVPEENLDLEHLKEKKKEVTQKIDEKQEDYEYKKIKRKEKQQAKVGLESLVNKVDESELKQKFETYKEKQNALRDVESEISLVENNLDKNKSSYDHLKNHSEFDPDCEYCVERNKRDAEKLGDLEEKIKGDEEGLESLKEKRGDLKDFFENNDTEKKWNKYQDIKERLEEHESYISQKEYEISKIENALQGLESRLEEINEDIELYHEIKDRLKHNEDVQEEIQEMENKVSHLENEIDELDSEMKNVHGDIKVQESRKETINEKIERFQEISERYEAYDCYLSAVKRDGIPYELIEKSLPEIEEEINNILSQIVNFSIVFETDGKNINGWMVSGEDNIVPLNNASGMEGFVSSLAIRVALTNISNLPRSNFLAIDEGFGVLDAEKRNSLRMVFDYFKTSFSFVLFVTHLDSLRDIADDILEVRKKDEFSSVKYDH